MPPVKLINFSKSILPLSSISNTKKISCNENGYFPVYQSDRYGFNNPDIEWNKDNIEYLLVGDSFAHGDCVNADDNLAAQFRNLINSDFSVISLGHSGNGPLFEFATLREYFPSNKTVKNVIWLYYEANDLSNLNKEKKNNILFNYLKNPKFSQNLKDKQMKINTLIENFFLQEYKFYNQNNLIQNNKNNNQIIHFFKFQEIRKNILDNYFGGIDSDFIRILSFSDQLVKENNSQLYFVYIPEYFRFKKDTEIQSSSKKYKRIIKIVKKLNIPIIDLKEKISKEEKPLSFFSVNGVHFNEEGYKFAAEKIFEKIKR